MNEPLLSSLLDTTNVGAGPTYLPSSLGMELEGNDLSLSGKIIEGDAETNTMTVEVTNDEDAANADWEQVYFFNNITNQWANSVTCNAQTTNFALSLDKLNFRRVRVKFVGGASATNTVIIKARRK